MVKNYLLILVTFSFYHVSGQHDIPPREMPGTTEAAELTIAKINKPYTYETEPPSELEILVQNTGEKTVNTLVLNYQIDDQPPQGIKIGELAIAAKKWKKIHTPIRWYNDAQGTYHLKFWIGAVNGYSGKKSETGIYSRKVEIGASIPNIIDEYLNYTPVITEIGNKFDMLQKPTDLDFHPVLSRKELWVINKRSENIGGSTVTYFDAGTSSQTDQHRIDGNAWHFMSLPTGIAFSENENFANSPGVFDANHNGAPPFTGPALWSSDPNVYAQPSGGNGSHLDMLHESPECQGIAHEVDNAFWVFDGYNGDIVRYDFVDDHGPGNDYHADGIIHRYSEEAVAKDPNDKVVSHLVYDKTSDWLYVVDYGNQRVIRLDATSGSKGGTPTFGPFEPLAEYTHIVNYTWETVIDSGLTEPAGIDLIEDRLLVSDYATGEVIIYDISSMPAVELGRISTPAIGIMGIKIGPEGKIWYVDHDDDAVYRIGHENMNLAENGNLQYNLFPNPSRGTVRLKGAELKGLELHVYSATGSILHRQMLELNDNTINLEFLSPGIYSMVISGKNGKTAQSEKLIIAK